MTIYMLEHIYVQMYITNMTLSPDSVLKLLADPTRLRILMLLHRQGELCVCELTCALDDIQPKISRHLALLRDAQVVSDRRAGQWIYYQLNPRLPDWTGDILAALARGTKNRKIYVDDQRKLKQMPNRPENRICEPA